MAPLPSLADFPPVFLIVFAVALGLVLGSFLNVVIYRLPRGENIAFPGSHCPHCGQPIKPYDNIPVLSWLVLRGRARCCKAPISPRYPLVEAIGGLLAWAVMRSIVLELPGDPSIGRAFAVFAAYLALGLGLVAAAFIDLEHMLLPDELTLGGAGLGIATVPLRPDIHFKEALLGAAIGFLVVWLPFVVLYEKVRGRPGMGLGDAKLVMLAGAWFGWLGAAFALLAGAVQATAVMLALLAAGRKIEEPAAVLEERRMLRDALEQAQGAEREALERELADDPLAVDPEPGVGGARLAFGPFIVLAILEFMFYGPVIRTELMGGLFVP
ncbi:MAG TPA: prepilin peptidase [Polyangiaceae bacterium]|nr:prepilin peptidase [Polyangiaceae bacterium]